MKLFITCLVLLLFSCGKPGTHESARVASLHVYEPQTDLGMAIDPALLEKWRGSCALCHVAGQAGAPRMGDVTAWSSRVDRGLDKMLESTLVGLERMPPLGYCMDCSEADFVLLIQMMTGKTDAL